MYHTENPIFLQTLNDHQRSTYFTLANKYRLITFCNKLPANIKNIFSGAYIGNISKAYLTVGNLVSALVYTNNGICINYK